MRIMELESVRFPIDQSKLAELARAFHDPDPVWYDEGAAAAAGFDAAPVPPTVTVLADHWREDGAVSHALRLGLDLQRLLHGEAAWEYFHPIRMGDEILMSVRVLDRTTRNGKRGGTMTFVELEMTYTNQHGTVVARRHDTLIETGTGA
jgi:N-terminal half of MaoC dehydratase